MKKTAIVPGSFDPATLGHVDLIRRAAKIFDEVHAVVMVNAEKSSGMFSPDERLAIIKSAVRDIENVKCAICCGLTSDYTKENGISFIAKGVRNGTDFDYEYSLSEIMKHFHEGIETVLIPSDPALSYMSSTYARERIRHGNDLSDNAHGKTTTLKKEYYEKKQ